MAGFPPPPRDSGRPTTCLVSREIPGVVRQRPHLLFDVSGNEDGQGVLVPLSDQFPDLRVGLHERDQIV